MGNYGQLVVELRTKNGDTREDLAKKLSMPITTLGKYERGERKIKPELLQRIAEIYDVPVASLFGEDIQLPEELANIGVKWIKFIKEMEDKNLTPEQIKNTVEFLEKMGLTDFKKS